MGENELEQNQNVNNVQSLNTPGFMQSISDFLPKYEQIRTRHLAYGLAAYLSLIAAVLAVKTVVTGPEAFAFINGLVTACFALSRGDAK